MKRFKFNLEAVLKERQRVEDLKSREWILARSLLQKMQDELVLLRETLEGSLADGGRLAAVDGGSVALFGILDSFIAGTKMRISWKQSEIERASKLVERKRLEYLQAMQKRKAIEKLKERKLADHKELEKKMELKALDDIYIMSRGAASQGASEEGEDSV